MKNLKCSQIGFVIAALVLLATLAGPLVYQAQAAPGDPPIRVPVRWCVLEGDGPTLQDPTIVGEEAIVGVLWSRHERATDRIFLPKANISFRSGATFGMSEFPIIEDVVDIGAPGDVVSPLIDNSELEALWDACLQAWIDSDPNAVGILAVQINRFVDGNGAFIDTIGGAGYSNGIGSRVAVIDLAYMCGENVCPGQPFTLFFDDLFEDGDLQEKTLAHELGHSLSLDHIIPPDGNLSCDTCDNLMQYRYPSDPDPNVDMFGTMITAAQVDQMVEFLQAGNVPGADNVPDNPPEARFNYRLDELGDAEEFGFADINRIGAADDPSSGEIRVSASFSEFPEEVLYFVTFLVDVDNDETTGSEPGGAELRANVTISAFSDEPGVSVAVSQFDPATEEFEPVQDPGIAAQLVPRGIIIDHFFSGEAETVDTGYRLTISIPSDTIPPLGSEIVMEVLVTMEVADFGTFDLDDARQLIPFETPDYPSCQTLPDTAGQGDQVTIQAFDLPPDRPVHALLGDEEIAAGATTDLTGFVELEFNVPLDARIGLRLITVGIDDDATAITADCEITVTAADGESDDDEKLKLLKSYEELLHGFEWLLMEQPQQDPELLKSHEDLLHSFDRLLQKRQVEQGFVEKELLLSLECLLHGFENLLHLYFGLEPSLAIQKCLGPQPALPDLTVQLVNAPTRVDCETNSDGSIDCEVTVEFEVTNLSDVDVTADFDVLIQGDQVPDEVITVAGGLLANTTEMFSVTLGPGGNCYDPDCTVTVTVDSGNEITESDESNNIDSRTDIG